MATGIKLNNMNIIALKGKGNSGKSTTIRLLHDLLIADDYEVVNTNFESLGGDFRTVFSKNGKIIGITSSGDTFDLVRNNLKILVDLECNICVCACRSYDRSDHGTNAAIDTFLPTYKKQYVDKTITTISAQQSIANEKDCQILFQAVEGLVQL